MAEMFETPDAPPPPAPAATPRYTKPKWSAPPTPERPFWLEVLKDGHVITKHNLDREDFLVGRSPSSDLVLDHPSISRYHAVIQFHREGRVFIYDMGSTHGTKLNKMDVRAKAFCRLRVGDMLQFGASSRLFVLCGTRDAELEVEEEKEAIAVKMGEERRSELSIPVAVRNVENENENGNDEEEDVGVSWGFGEDAEYESDDEDSYSEGDDEDVKMKLKEMRKKKKKSKKEKEKEKEESLDAQDHDHESSGVLKLDIAHLKDQTSQVETIESLEVKRNNNLVKMAKIRRDLAMLKSKSHHEADDDIDTLDAFMGSVSNDLKADKEAKLQLELAECEKDGIRLSKLMKVAQPALVDLHASKNGHGSNPSSFGTGTGVETDPKFQFPLRVSTSAATTDSMKHGDGDGEHSGGQGEQDSSERDAVGGFDNSTSVNDNDKVKVEIRAYPEVKKSEGSRVEGEVSMYGAGLNIMRRNRNHKEGSGDSEDKGEGKGKPISLSPSRVQMAKREREIEREGDADVISPPKQEQKRPKKRLTTAELVARRQRLVELSRKASEKEIFVEESEWV